MLRHTAIFLTALSVFVGIFLLVERTSSPFFQKCISEESGDKGDQAAKESNSRISPIITAYVRCSGRFMDGHGVGLTAIASFIIAAFTATLWVATRQQADLTRRDFVATHRPRVVLRYIQGPEYNDDGHQFIWLKFVNTGANDAIIDAFGGDLAYRGGFNETWEIPGLDADLKDVQPITLVCGQRHVFTVTAKTSFKTDTLVSKSAWPGFQICAVGILRYRDGNGISRHTGFFRVLDDEGLRFVVSEHDSEMEYQD